MDAKLRPDVADVAAAGMHDERAGLVVGDAEVRFAVQVDVALARGKAHGDMQAAVGVEQDLCPVQQAKRRAPPARHVVAPQRDRARARAAARQRLPDEPAPRTDREQDRGRDGDAGPAKARRSLEAAREPAPRAVHVVGCVLMIGG